MKKLAAILLVSASSLAFSQNISDYEYVYVPTSFEKNMNKFELRNTLIQQLTAKKYKVIQEDNKSCAVLKADLLDDSSFFKNKVKISFKDCNNKIIQELKGSTDDKDFETGYPDALKNATKTLSISNPKTTASLESPKEIPATTIADNVNTAPITTTEEKALTYSNANATYQLIKLGQNNFILVSSKSSTPIAKLAESSKAGIFHVVLENNSPTVGYVENGNIIIDIPKSDGTFSKEVFTKK